MKVQLLTPWDNAWIPYIKAEFEKRGYEFSCGKIWDGKPKDLVLHGWTGLTKPVPNARNVMFLRRFELFDGMLGRVDWSNVYTLICVNTWIADRVREIFAANGVSTPVKVIYNGTDLEKWTYKDRTAGKKIGMACHVHPKKNLPLAVQILAALAPEYELHIAGGVQDSCTAEYLIHMGHLVGRKILIYDHISHNKLDEWWDGMDYCLSTSLSEGNPNNVIEAMAKGIQPVIHEWPGSQYQFPAELRFRSVAEAAYIIRIGMYNSAKYRKIVEKDFSLKQYELVADACCELL